MLDPCSWQVILFTLNMASLASVDTATASCAAVATAATTATVSAPEVDPMFGSIDTVFPTFVGRLIVGMAC